jgi:hypothetical protein
MADDVTTIKIARATKDRLTGLKEQLNIADYESVVAHLIETHQPKSDDATVCLEMNSSKYRWLLAQQNKCDCRKLLERSKT